MPTEGTAEIRRRRQNVRGSGPGAVHQRAHLGDVPPRLELWAQLAQAVKRDRALGRQTIVRDFSASPRSVRRDGHGAVATSARMTERVLTSDGPRPESSSSATSRAVANWSRRACVATIIPPSRARSKNLVQTRSSLG